MEPFNFDPREEYTQKCGEVFLTNIGLMIFHCTLCDTKCRGFEKFADHVRVEHLFAILSAAEIDTAFEICNEECEDNKENGVEEVISAIGEEHVMFEIMPDEEHIEEPEYLDTLQEIQEDLVEQDQDTYVVEDEIYLCKEEEDQQEQDIVEDNNEIELDAEEISHQVLTNGIDIDLSNGIRFLQKKDPKTPLELRIHKCPICGTGFKEKHNMHHHLRRHSNTKNFQCTECEKRFYTKTERRIHMRTHTKYRPYLCPECGLTFQTNSQLEVHLKKHRGQRDFHCTECDRSFFKNSELKEHLQYHANDRPYACSICNFAFTKQHLLTRHMKLHENKRPYKCRFCPSRFNQSTGLRIHEKNVHRQCGNRPVLENSF